MQSRGESKWTLPLGAQALLQSAHTSSPPFLFKAALGRLLFTQGRAGRAMQGPRSGSCPGSPPLIQAASFILLPALVGEHSGAFKVPTLPAPCWEPADPPVCLSD